MYTYMYELSFLFVVDRRVIKHYLRRIKREVKYAKNFVLMIPPKMQTPEWTIPFSQSEPQTDWDETGRCSAQLEKKPNQLSDLPSESFFHIIFLGSLFCLHSLSCSKTSPKSGQYQLWALTRIFLSNKTHAHTDARTHAHTHTNKQTNKTKQNHTKTHSNYKGVNVYDNTVEYCETGAYNRSLYI